MTFPTTYIAMLGYDVTLEFGHPQYGLLPGYRGTELAYNAKM